MTVGAGALEHGWRLAETRGPSAPDAVTADPIDAAVAVGPLMVGVDGVGVRHLLVPLPEDVDVPAEPFGSAITLRTRPLILNGDEQHYLDLACLRPDLFDEFAVLAADVVEAVEADAEDPLAATVQVLNAWRDLLRSISAPRLDRGGVIGLFAELAVLETVLERDPRRRVECWTGPSRGRYDFQRGPIVLEVKGSTARRGRPIIVHGIDQLEDPPNGDLYLWWIRLEVGIERGDSLSAIVERLLDRAQNPADLEQKLRNTGYEFETPELYERPLLSELERRLYRVDQSFPRLTRAHLIRGDLPRGVVAVTYEIDLSGDDPKPVAPQEEHRVLTTLAGIK